MRYTCCGRQMNLHGYDRQLRNYPPRRRRRCPICRRVLVDRPTRHPNGTRGQAYKEDRGRTRVYLGREDPCSNSAGWQYVYRVEVSTTLGRTLRSDEHVHHVDGDVTNNSLSNLELVAAEYHGRLHASAVLLAETVDGSFAELPTPQGPFRWPRWGAVLGNLAVDGG